MSGATLCTMPPCRITSAFTWRVDVGSQVKHLEDGLASLRGASDTLEKALGAVATAADVADVARAMSLATEALRMVSRGLDAEAVACAVDEAEEAQAEVTGAVRSTRCEAPALLLKAPPLLTPLVQWHVCAALPLPCPQVAEATAAVQPRSHDDAALEAELEALVAGGQSPLVTPVPAPAVRGAAVPAAAAPAPMPAPVPAPVPALAAPATVRAPASAAPPADDEMDAELEALAAEMAIAPAPVDFPAVAMGPVAVARDEDNTGAAEPELLTS